MSRKRPRTIYRLRCRYRRAARWAAVIGALVGIGVVAAALVPAIVAGRHVPMASYAIGLGITALAALLPYALVRRRWRSIRERHEE